VNLPYPGASVGAAILVLMFLQGCSHPSIGDQIQNYQEKLARVLDEDLPGSEPETLPSLPRARALRLEFSEESLNLLEFFQLMDCELHELIADHNSSLGRLATPSQELVYQLRFLDAAQSCISQITEDQPELAETLRLVTENKRQQLPGYIWQATLGGKEFRSFWQPGYNDYIADELSEVDLALSRLNHLVTRWINGNYEVDSKELETLLGTLRQGDGGRLVAAWQQAASGLNGASAILEARLDRKPLCFPQMVTSKADIFRNVVMGDFIGQIQPVVAKMNRRYYSGFRIVEAMETILAAAEPQAYRAWRLHRNNKLKEARAAVPAHVAALEPIMKQCGFLPG